MQKSPTHTNRLIDSTSPYLLQHAHNPVNWNPWGPEALARSRRENRPIFLSIGYSACHWCHVMEHLVFENPQLAALMNQHFVNIKVDREERPDLDEVYMLATQVMTGQGGWPMSVWLTPDLEPFYAGTYFPPEDGYGRPGFGRLITALAEAWSTREPDLRAQAAKVAQAVRMYLNEAEANADAGPPRGIHFQPTLQRALEQWSDRFDEEHGGLGTAPKFPPSQALALWLELLRPEHATKENITLDAPAARRVQSMLTTTLDAMMRGGIYDQIAGAFARYSTDQFWLVPHFEKMLYDNAQLAPVYAQAAADLNRPDYARVARQTLDFWLRDMTSPEGPFYSTLDADSEGHEGKFYVWTLAEIRAALTNPDDAALLIRHFGITEEGNWHEGGAGANVLFIAHTAETLTAEYKTTPSQLQNRIDQLCEILRTRRAQRIPPGLDDKILTGWNGLMIAALAISARALNEPRYLAAAERAAAWLLAHHTTPEGLLLRTSRHHGPAHTPGFLEDYAYLLHGLVELITSLGNSSTAAKFTAHATQIANLMLHHFEDKTHGGFFFTTTAHDTLFARIKNATDGATPSANGLAIRALFRLAKLTNIQKYAEAATRAVNAFAPTIEKQPMQFPTILNVLAHQQRTASLPAASLAPAVPTAPAATSSVNILQLEATPLDPIPPGAAFTLHLTLTIARSYHIQPHQPADKSAIATTIRLRADVPLAAQQWTYPPAAAITIGNTTIEGYENTITLEARITLDRAAKPGAHSIRAILTAQPCRHDACLAPQTVTLEIPLDITA